MKSVAVLAAVVLLLSAALAWFAPASLLDARIDNATHGQLRLANTAGTVWNGRGVVTNAQGSWSLPVRWTIDPRSVVLREPAITLQAAEGGAQFIDTVPRGTIGWHGEAITLDGVAFTLPAAALDGSLPAGGAVAFGGYIAFDAPHASWGAAGSGAGGQSGGGAATAQWSGARVAGAAGTLALGTVTMNFTPRDGRIQGRVGNSGGDVRIDGEFTLDDAGVNLNATIAPLPSTPPAVARALSVLGTPDATGAVRVQWRSGNR